MKILKIIAFVFGAIVALTIFGKVRQKLALNAPAKTAAQSEAAKNSADPGLSPAGFFLLTREEAVNPRVTIMSVPNCPSHETALARNLEASLQSAGIPCEMTQHIGFEFHDPADMERVQKYMANVPAPLVLVRGWAKGNPSVQDVIAQYQAGK